MRSSSLATWHQFPFIPLFLIVLSIYPIHGLDSANYKFGIVDGAPEMISNASAIIENVASFDECVEKCSEEYTCILAYQANSTDPCYLFQWNSIQQVVKNESGGVGQVAFKVFTDQPSCELNLPLLLNGKIYQLYQNDTSEFLWKIDTSENGWTITYIGKRVEQQPLICGNFTNNRPYPDGCDPKCEVTMVQVYAVPGPLTDVHNEEEILTWNECLYFCHEKPDCFVVHFYDDLSIKCRWWSIDRIFFLNRTEARTSNGIHMAVKVVLSKKTCKMTTEQLMDDQYYLPYNRIRQAWARSVFRVRATPKYYKFQTYLDEEHLYVRSIPGCEADTMASQIMATENAHKADFGPIVCMRLYDHPNITQAAASELCQEMDGHLLTERFKGFVTDGCSTRSRAVMPWGWNIPIERWGFRDVFQPHKPVKIWFGLEKDQSSGQFKWQDPSQIVATGEEQELCSQATGKEFVTKTLTDPNPMTWASGQPNMAPGLDCAWLKYDYEAKLPFPGYGFEAARCNDVADGFACGTKPQLEKGIPKFQTFLDEYGKTIENAGHHQYNFDPEK